LLELSEIGGKKHYDLIVIGGGSGGLACSKEGKYVEKITAIFAVAWGM